MCSWRRTSRLVERFEWHYTPKHGSWLDLAESELAFCRRSASTAASPINKPSSTKSPPGSTKVRGIPDMSPIRSYET